jgi:hypothetical protein
VGALLQSARSTNGIFVFSGQSRLKAVSTLFALFLRKFDGPSIETFDDGHRTFQRSMECLPVAKSDVGLSLFTLFTFV